MNYEDPKIDLICQHSMDGTIIPIKFRVKDEDDEMREFMVKGYREASIPGLLSFDCNVVVNSMLKRVNIYTSGTANNGIWHVKMK